MKKPAKVLAGVVGAVVLLVIVGVVLALIMVDAIAKKGIESGGTYAMGVNTSLDNASIGLTSGKFGLSGLTIDNPQGFEGKFLKLGDAGLDVTLGSLMKDTVVVPRFALANVEVDLKRNASGANYNAILNNLKRFESQDKAAPKNDKPGKQFKINEITINNVVVHLDLVGGPSGLTQLNIPIHEIKLTNVGSDGSGVDIAELSSTILQAILAAAVDKGGSLIPADVMGDLNAGLGQLSGLANVGVEAVGKVGDQITKLGGTLGDAAKGVGDATKNVEDAAKGVGDAVKGIGGLFEPKDKKK